MAAEIVHHSRPGKTEERESEDTCGVKRKMKLRFSLSMLSEEDLEISGDQELSHPECKDEDTEDNCFDDDDQLLGLMAKMSFNLVVQDPDTDCSCDRQFNDIVIMPEQADFAFISAQIGKLIQEHKDLFLKSKCMLKYIASEQNEIYLEDTMSAKISIYQCMAKDTEPGVPVALNFSGTNNFFSCTNEGEEKILKVTSYDKKKLHKSGDDQEKTPLVFYMSQTPDGLRHFESALHRGWFIHTVDGDAVKMQRGKLASSNCFVLIETDSTKTIHY